MADDFFQEPKPETTELEKIKIGEKEYSQDELTKLVGLGEFADRVQQEQDRSVKDIYPKYIETTKELSELKKKVGEFETFQARLTGKDQEVTPEMMAEDAKAKLKELGYLPSEEINKVVQEQVMAHIQAKELLDEVKGINRIAEEAGKPKVDPNELFNYMDQTGIKDPTIAYEVKFKNELKSWEQTKVNEIKPQGFTTQETSSAGAKTPTEERPKSPEALKAQLESFWKSQSGNENA
jgi:hypothetical protein